MSTSPAVVGSPGSIRTVCATVLVVMALAACGDGSTAAPGTTPGSGSTAGGDRQVAAADGLLADPVSVDADVPALTGLSADLLVAVQEAAADAADDNVEVLITSGWRSVDYQEQLIADAVDEYGSAEEAARWVASPTESQHVSGAAVDIGPTEAAYWMSRFGSRYGLCQTYANEIWHYQLATEPGGECPAPVADAAR